MCSVFSWTVHLTLAESRFQCSRAINYTAAINDPSGVSACVLDHEALEGPSLLPSCIPRIVAKAPAEGTTPVVHQSGAGFVCSGDPPLG